MQYHFADHILDTSRRELHRGGAPIALEPQVFDLLAYLLKNRERLVTKDDLIASVWGGRIVSDSTLASRINAARKAVGDSGQAQRLIRTAARRGIRFVGTVQVFPDECAPGPAVTPARVTQRPVLPQADGPAIAVLPFVNLSGTEQDYFSDGISEDIIAALSRLHRFTVIGRNSAFSYKGRAVPMRHIAEELGVAYLVEGSVRRNGDCVRITVELDDVATARHLWAERYDRDLADVFAVQDDITAAIVAAIEPQLVLAEGVRVARKPPGSLDAWDLVMRALPHYWRATRADNKAAQALLEQAIAIDPNYAHALALLSVSHAFGAYMGWEDITVAVAAAHRAARAALRADAEDPWAQLAMAGVLVYQARFEDALAGFEQALRLNPNFSLAHGYYGLVLAYCERWEEGAAAARRALRLSPRDPFSAVFNCIAAYAEFVGRNYDTAVRLAREAVRQRRDFVAAHRVLTAAAAMAGETDLARSALAELRRIQADISLDWITARIPFREDAEREHYLEALRRAGLE